MTRRAALQVLIGVAVAAAALAAGSLMRLGGRAAAVAAGPTAVGLMGARLPDVDGRTQAFQQWRGKVLVVNFWATWCVPCREEIPAFIKVQNRWGGQGLQIVGVAIDENDKVRPYAAQLKINYPILVGGLDGIDLARQAGNRLGGLPFTVIFDRRGNPVHSQLGGAMTQEKLEQFIRPLL